MRKANERPRRGGDRLCALRAARRVPAQPASPLPPAPRPSAAHRLVAGRGMRTPPAPGGQVSGGRGARARGAPATRTWPGPPSRSQGSCRSAELCPQPGRPAPAPGVSALSALVGEVGLPASPRTGPQKRSLGPRCPLRALCRLPGAGWAGLAPGRREKGPLLPRSFRKCF